ncbi:F-box incomplete domain containing protein [Pandoravirus neocaledonia]|uniref:F-box incomplete domain containing protein n=1 Tax=Pandoravirus neocaledonia TaxID=2107708 RepID=A0A2U7UCI0_9VIRU|nr:F-box incomplete domain containing protein [Pandoravirus neocaledonia]AVK76040.1 F-box incomplete domain containing protein [Pandoravirus neocaledonia]
MHADRALPSAMTMTMLPSEMVHAIMSHVDAEWYPMAAQVCRLWRACVIEVAPSGPIADYDIDVFYALCINERTLGAAVRGGYVDTIAWMARVSGRGDAYPRALAMAQWVASVLSPNLSWSDILNSAARDGRADVLIWDAGCARDRDGLHSSSALCAAIVHASNQLLHSVCLAYQTRATKSHRLLSDRRLFNCAVARGNIGALSTIVEGGCEVGPSALFLAALCRDNDVIRIVRTAFDSARPNRQWALAAARWLYDQRVCAPTNTSTEPDADSALVPGDVRLPWRPHVRAPSPIDLLPGGALGDLVLLDDDPLASVGRCLNALIRPLLVGDSNVVSGDLDTWIATAPLRVDTSFGVQQQVGRILRTENAEPVFVHIADFERGYSTRAEEYLAEMACGRR